MLGGQGEEQRMLPKLVVIQSTRTLEAAIDLRSQIILTFAFLLGWHGNNKLPPKKSTELRDRSLFGRAL